MKVIRSILFFTIPGIFMFLGMEYALPILSKTFLGFPWAVLISLWTPCIIMFLIIMIKWKRSGIDAKNYFWINKLSKKTVLISILIFISIQVLELLLHQSSMFLSNLPGFTYPQHYPNLFKPDYNFSYPLTTFFGLDVSRNYSIIIFWSVWLVVNIGCEEILWRGYALPRMEKVFGKWAWLVNGLLWNFAIHYFLRWSYITLLPVSLLLPYICQKNRSIWPGIIIHGIGNTLLFILIIPSVFTHP